MANIEKMFQEEIRDKKRIGSNIFSRVSTRKGGSNQALRTPYLYMTAKEKRKLNGEVRSFNMNDIISYNEFSELSPKEQTDLMTHWRNIYTGTKIQQGMGISRSLFYRIIDKLNLPKSDRFPKSSKAKVLLSDDEMKRYKKEFIDFSKYKELNKEQQTELLDAYIKDYGTVSSVADEWNGSDKAYLYYISGRAKKLKKKKEEKSVAISSTPKKTKEVADTESKPKETRIIPNPPQNEEDIESFAVSLLNSIGYFDKKEDMPETTEEVSPESSEPAVKEESNDRHNSDIDIETNSFTFELKGKYNAQTIIKRVQLALEVMEDESELLDLEIKIRGSK